MDPNIEIFVLTKAVLEFIKHRLGGLVNLKKRQEVFAGLPRFIF